MAQFHQDKVNSDVYPLKFIFNKSLPSFAAIKLTLHTSYETNEDNKKKVKSSISYAFMFLSFYSPKLRTRIITDGFSILLLFSLLLWFGFYFERKMQKFANSPVSCGSLWGWIIIFEISAEYFTLILV